mgnify:CR=1 FL=1
MCKDLDGGCDDNDGDGLADSLYSEFRFAGGGMYHFYNPDPMENPDNWTATFIHDFSDAYSAAWTGDMVTTYDVVQYFYPLLSASHEEGSQVMWYGASNMSSASYSADSTYEARDIDLYVAKSVDNGRTWWGKCMDDDGAMYDCQEPENITNTPNQLEVGMHLANIGTDNDIGIFCQVPNFNVETYPPAAGYEDYLNYVYIGRYENLDYELDVVFNTKVNKENTTKHNHYSFYYDDESIKKVRELSSKDIETYNYSCEEYK